MTHLNFLFVFAKNKMYLKFVRYYLSSLFYFFKFQKKKISLQ